MLFDNEDMEINEDYLDDEQPINIAMSNAEGDEDFDDFDDSIEDIDFSEIRGKSFKKSFAKVNTKIKKKQQKKKKLTSRLGKRKKKPLTQEFYVKRKASLISPNEKKLSKVIVPRDRKVIVEGISKFILSQDKKDDALRNIGYYKGKKLKELVFTINNSSALDFNFSLFNPSMPLDYLYSTSLNLNDKIEVAGGNVSYTDVVFNLLANPIAIRNAKFVITGPQQAAQQNVSLQVQMKSATGVTEVTPLQLSLQVDNMQVEGYVISFDVQGVLNRPFIADGMDVVNYRVLAGNSVTMCFYYEQKKIKKLFFPEALEEPKKLF